MGIFDNAKSIVLGNKEVKSIEIDGGTIWEKEVEPPAPSTHTITINCGNFYSSTQITMNNITVTSDNRGVATFTDVADGTYDVFAFSTELQKDVKTTITVDENTLHFDVTNQWTPIESAE